MVHVLRLSPNLNSNRDNKVLLRISNQISSSKVLLVLHHLVNLRTLPTSIHLQVALVAVDPQDLVFLLCHLVLLQDGMPHQIKAFHLHHSLRMAIHNNSALLVNLVNIHSNISH